MSHLGNSEVSLLAEGLESYLDGHSSLTPASGVTWARSILLGANCVGEDCHAYNGQNLVVV